MILIKNRFLIKSIMILKNTVYRLTFGNGGHSVKVDICPKIYVVSKDISFYRVHNLRFNSIICDYTSSAFEYLNVSALKSITLYSGAYTEKY